MFQVYRVSAKSINFLYNIVGSWIRHWHIAAIPTVLILKIKGRMKTLKVVLMRYAAIVDLSVKQPVASSCRQTMASNQACNVSSDAVLSSGFAKVHRMCILFSCQVGTSGGIQEYFAKREGRSLTMYSSGNNAEEGATMLKVGTMRKY